MKSLLLVCAATLTLWGCAPGSNADPKASETDVSAAIEYDGEKIEAIHISQDGFELDLAAPIDYRKGNRLVVEFDPAFGHMVVRSGPVYQLEIIQQKGSFQDLLETLESDMVFRYQLFGETKTSTLYRQYIPDTEEEFWHFYFTFSHNGEDYVIKDAAMSELNEYQSRKIYKALLWAVEQMTAGEGAA